MMLEGRKWAPGQGGEGRGASLGSDGREGMGHDPCGLQGLWDLVPSRGGMDEERSRSGQASQVGC